MLAPVGAGFLRRPTQRARGTYRDVVMRRSREGRVQFIGDAVHAMSSQLGQGANMVLLDPWTLAQCLRSEATVDIALKKYGALRSGHVGIYQLINRWLKPLLQSHSRVGSWLRDTTFYPMNRLPIARTSMLRILSGLQQGYFGVYDGIDVGEST